MYKIVLGELGVILFEKHSRLSGSSKLLLQVCNHEFKVKPVS